AERDAEEGRQRQAEEQAAAPKKLAGLAAVPVGVQSSFSDALDRLLKEEEKALVARFAGASGEELAGELLDAVPAPDALLGRLPTGDACYVVMRAGGRSLLFMTWLPDGGRFLAAKTRMKCSTLKASALEAVRTGVGPGHVLAQAEVTDEAALAGALMRDWSKIQATVQETSL
ncbi:unnamed protein product, partial [Prorocentrum cordatum]